MSYIKLNNLSVGYGSKVVVQDINLGFVKGKMTCILGANGAGKTTLLKTIANIISKMDGNVEIAGKDLSFYKPLHLAQEMSVVLSNRVDLFSMTGFDVASMGRYPHTGFFGILSAEDLDFVSVCMDQCGAGHLKEKLFARMSDGEKQKVMISRGLAQSPNVLLLDEPTSHLDIKYKLDILNTLKSLCINGGKTVICTLHEPDLAIKCCDYLLLVRDDKILAYGETDEVVASGKLDELYGFENNQFNPLIGIVEFKASNSKKVFIIGSDENAPALLQALNRRQLGFAAGVLHTNDVSYHIAKTMSAPLITAEPYTMISKQQLDAAFALAQQYEHIVRCDFPLCELNENNGQLCGMLQARGRTIEDFKTDSMQAILAKIQ